MRYLIVLLIGAALGAGGMYLALEWPTDSDAEDEATADQTARVQTEVVRQIAARAENKPAEASCAPRAGSSWIASSTVRVEHRVVAVPPPAPPPVRGSFRRLFDGGSAS